MWWPFKKRDLRLKRIEARLDSAAELIHYLLERNRAMNAKLQQLHDLVAAESTAIASVKTLLEGLLLQLQEANGDPAAVDAIIAQVQANIDALAAAAAEVPPTV